MKQSALFAIVLFLVGLTVACGAQPTLKSMLTAIENQAGVVSASTRATLKSTSEGIKEAASEKSSESRDEKLTETCASFESAWTNSKTGLKTMKDQLQDLKTETDTFFKLLDAETRQIQGDRKSEEAANRQLRINWDAKVAAVERSIKKIEGLHSQGNDFSHKLKLQGLRNQIETNMQGLENLTAEADRLFGELEANLADAQKSLPHS